MSRLFIKSLANFAQPKTSRPVLVTSRCCKHNESTSRPQALTMLSISQVPNPYTKQLILENSKINESLIDGRELLFTGNLSNSEVLQDKTSMDKDVKDMQNQASMEQLTKIADAMTHHLPRFFNTPHPFELYTKDAVFMDNVRQVRIQGLAQYATRLAIVKLYYRLRYASSKCELLNLVKHPEESCIKIRWRIVSKPGIAQFLLYFYKYHALDIWHDGVSTLYVNKDGKIYCHSCDNIDVDVSKGEIKKTIKNPVVDGGLNV